jgi:hypothetical protein
MSVMRPPIPIQRAPGNPMAGHDYPRTWEEFCAFFPDETSCVRYLERLSWPDGFLCPRCGWAEEPWRGSRRRLVCRCCGHETTVTAGTLFQGTRTPLRQWLAAAWHVSTAEEGVSARGLQRALGIGSYETAWTILHRLRRAMVRSGRPRLEGLAQVGRIALPARPARRRPGRAAPERARRPRAVVAIAVEDEGSEPGRVRMQRLTSGSDRDLARFIAWALEPETLVRVVGVRDPGVRLELARRVPPAADQGGARPFGTPLLHLCAVQERLERWLLGTHQGAASSEQLDWYLDEFTFRFNRRSARHRGLLFYRLVEEALVTPPQPYDAMIATSADIGRSARRPRRR